jgi:hypothetical protein
MGPLNDAEDVVQETSVRAGVRARFRSGRRAVPGYTELSVTRICSTAEQRQSLQSGVTAASSLSSRSRHQAVWRGLAAAESRCDSRICLRRPGGGRRNRGQRPAWRSPASAQGSAASILREVVGLAGGGGGRGAGHHHRRRSQPAFRFAAEAMTTGWLAMLPNRGRRPGGRLAKCVTAVEPTRRRQRGAHLPRRRHHPGHRLRRPEAGGQVRLPKGTHRVRC